MMDRNAQPRRQCPLASPGRRSTGWPSAVRSAGQYRGPTTGE